MTNNIEIEAWFGGDGTAIGPIDAMLIEMLPNDEAKILIIDEIWLDNIGWKEEDGPYQYTCDRLPTNHRVRYDDYCWCNKGDGGSKDFYYCCG